MVVFLGLGDGTFTAAGAYPTGPSPVHAAVGDLDGDGKLDLVFANNDFFTGHSVSVLLGRGDGSFAPKVDYAVGPNVWSVDIGDFNGDGIPDIVTANRNEGAVSVLMGKGDGTFLPRVDYSTGGATTSVAAGDFDGDGKSDIAVANNTDDTLSVILGRCAP